MTAQTSISRGVTTKKATATRKSVQTKLRTHASLASLRGSSDVSGLRNTDRGSLVLAIDDAALLVSNDDNGVSLPENMLWW